MLVSDPVVPIGVLVEKVLLGALLLMVVLVPYWSLVPPCCLLQPASINAAPRIRIAFFMVQSFVTLFPLFTFQCRI